MKTTPKLLFPLFVLLLLQPSSAWANIYVPTLVEMISSPLIWSMYVVTMVITVPVILVIGFVETRVARKYIFGSFWRAFSQICLLNAVTSLISVPFTGSGVVWPGLPLSFALTIPAEAVLIGICLRKYFAVGSARSILALSARMNLASYALLSLVVLGLVYIPVIGNEHPEIARGVSGRIVLDPGSDGRVFDLASRTFIIGREHRRTGGLGRAECTSVGKTGTVIRVVAPDSAFGTQETYDATIESCRIDGGRWVTTTLGTVRKVKNVQAVSSDGQLVVCEMSGGRWVIYDRIKNAPTALWARLPTISGAAFSPDGRRIVVAEEIEHRKGVMSTYSSRTILLDLLTRTETSLGDIWVPVFSHDSSKIAWDDGSGITIYDCVRKSRKHMKPKGNVVGDPAWSPDDKLIAYIGTANPIASNRWQPDIRVIDVRSEKTAALYRGLFTAGAPCDMLWLE